jgi:hypothetical protein
MNAKLILGVVLLSSVASAFALPITPTYNTFGSQPTFTFGGSGIPNDAVAVTNLADGVVLGLSATGRCQTLPFAACGAPTTNDGAGTFTAQAGSPFANTLASWNFDFYVSTGTTANKTFKLFYDFDPVAANDQSTHGIWNFLNGGGTSQTFQNSQNLGSPFLGVSANLGPFGIITAPTFMPFDKDAHGTYTFALVAFDATNLEIGRAAIVVSVVPEPEAYGLALAGMAVVGFFGLRRKAAKPA